ncbi:MAG: hypothetical protein ACOC98_08465 [Thermodesulfobacteriota bacterium]
MGAFYVRLVKFADGLSGMAKVSLSLRLIQNFEFIGFFGCFGFSPKICGPPMSALLVFRAQETVAFFSNMSESADPFGNRTTASMVCKIGSTPY